MIAKAAPRRREQPSTIPTTALPVSGSLGHRPAHRNRNLSLAAPHADSSDKDCTSSRKSFTSPLGEGRWDHLDRDHRGVFEHLGNRVLSGALAAFVDDGMP